MKDKCVTCGVDSIYDFDEYIKFRIGYIVGVGQLCLNCYDKIYFKNKKGNRLNTISFSEALKKSKLKKIASKYT